MPFSLPSPFSISRFNFFCLQVLLTRASLLALTKSIYYFRQHGYRNNFHFPFCLIVSASQRVAMRFPAEKTLSFWIAIPLVRVILHWYAYGTDGRSHSHVTTSCYKSLWDAQITKFSYQWCSASRVRELRYNYYVNKNELLFPPCTLKIIGDQGNKHFMKLTRISKKVARFLRLNPFEKRTTSLRSKRFQSSYCAKTLATQAKEPQTKVSISDYTLTSVPVVSTSFPSFTSW